MAINDRVIDYTVTALGSDIVAYRRILRLTTISGGSWFVAFPDVQPSDWLQLSGNGGTVYLRASDFDATYTLLREETPVFLSALSLFGIRTFNLSSGPVAPGQAAADPAELVDFMTRAAEAEPGHSAA